MSYRWNKPWHISKVYSAWDKIVCNRVEEWEVENILNKIQEVVKYLVYYKKFIVEHNT